MNLSSTSPLFWKLWQDHQEHLHNQSLRLMAGNTADAEDALSTAMLRALQGFPAQSGTLFNGKAWLSRVLHNVCMDFHRERRRFSEPSDEPGSTKPTEPLMMEEPPDRVMLERERAQEIRTRVQALPPNLRRPFEMRFLQDMSYSDIASELQLTNCNARKRVQLAYCILRTTLADVVHAE